MLVVSFAWLDLFTDTHTQRKKKRHRTRWERGRGGGIKPLDWLQVDRTIGQSPKSEMSPREMESGDENSRALIFV